MKIKMENQAVSEIIGTVLLLGMAIALFSTVQIMVSSYPVYPAAPSADLVAYLDHGNITIVHHGGQSLELKDTEIILRSGDKTNISVAENHLDAKTSNGNEQWDISEIVMYNITNDLPTDFQNSYHNSLKVDVTVVDLKSNSVIMMGTVQEGST